MMLLVEKTMFVNLNAHNIAKRYRAAVSIAFRRALNLISRLQKWKQHNREDQHGNICRRFTSTKNRAVFENEEVPSGL